VLVRTSSSAIVEVIEPGEDWHVVRFCGCDSRGACLVGFSAVWTRNSWCEFVDASKVWEVFYVGGDFGDKKDRSLKRVGAVSSRFETVFTVARRRRLIAAVGHSPRTFPHASSATGSRHNF
jgi:hypothetical protein